MNSSILEKHLQYIVPQIRLALIKEPELKPLPVYNPDDLDLFVEPMKHYDVEHFVSFHLDVRNQIIGYQIVSQGTISASLVHPREVFKAAFLSNSSSIVVAHNHLAGSLTPSKEDLEVTEVLIKAGKLLGINVFDHIIVSSNGICSLRQTDGYLWK